MVNLQTADQALKNVYLGVVTEQLNLSSNPLLAKIEQTSSDVWGKEIIRLVSYGINGGIGAGDEVGDLPMAAGNNYAQFKLDLKNLYGTIEISDKAIRASQSNVGAFVNLLNAEMEGLLKASKYNLSRMLYGDGSGRLTVSVDIAEGKTMTVVNPSVLSIGLVVDIYSASGELKLKQARIVNIEGDKVTFDKELAGIADGSYLTVQNSNGHELTGLGAIFGTGDLYGVQRANNSWLNPYTATLNSISPIDVQNAIDSVDENSGSAINFITCGYALRNKYMQTLMDNRVNFDYTVLDGGFKALSHNGIPMYADRFVEKNAMYLLNTDDFKMHQLCDWRWLEGEGGNVIKQKAGTPTYTATLVKYADIICAKPCGQAKLTVNSL